MGLFKSDEEKLIDTILYRNIFKYEDVEKVKLVLESSNKNKKNIEIE